MRLPAFVIAMVLFQAEALQSHRRQLLTDGVLPDDFDDRMDAILPTFPYTLSPGSESSCQQQSLRGCRQGVTVKTATYGTTQKYNVVLCACGDGGYDTRSLADAIARVPGYLIGFVTSVTTVPPNGTVKGKMSQTGQMTIFGQQRLRTIIHESGHAQDFAQGGGNADFTSTDTWEQAVVRSTCRATTYSRRVGSLKEEYAEVMIIYTYNVYRGNRYPSFNTACLDPELQTLGTFTRSLSG